MNSLVRTVEKYSMLRGGDCVLCALSAGADSTCMTHALARARGTLGITPAAAHFSHGIRPESARHELEMARALCNRLGIELFTGRGDAPAHARAHGLSLEDAARRLRYAFLRQTLENWRPGGKIATAHNLGDQAETVLFNLVRGAGPAGVKGIAPVSGNIIRPLIETPREAIERYLERHALPFARDASNADLDYTRNRLRLEILPRFGAVNEKYLENIARAGFFVGQAVDFIDSHALQLLSLREGQAEIPASGLARAHGAVAARALALAYGHVAGGGGIYQVHIEAVLALARGGSPSAEACLPQGITARREYGSIIFERARTRTSDGPVGIMPGQSVEWSGWRVGLSQTAREGAMKIPARDARFPLTVRSRQPGDVIVTPFGKKSLKKLMIDRKIPKNLRDITPVLCDNNVVLCVAGIDFRADARDETQFLYITFENLERKI